MTDDEPFDHISIEEIMCRINGNCGGNSTTGLGAADFTAEPPIALVSVQNWFRLTCSVVYSTLALVALVGNALFCLVIWRSSKLHSVTNLLMANLGVANLVLLCFHPPLFIVSYVIQADWLLGAFMCKACSSITYMTVTASFWFMAIVAVDRWLAIFDRHRRLTVRSAVWLSAGAWLASFLVASPYLHFFDIESRRRHELGGLQLDLDSLLDPNYTFAGQTDASTMTTRCINKRCMQDGCRKPLLFLTIAVQFVVPLLVMAPAYGHLALHLLRRPTVIGASNPTRARRARQRKRRVLVTLLSIVGSLLLCWAPLNVFAIAHTLGQLAGRLRDPLAVLVLANMLATLSVCLTPILYMMNDAYRSELLRLVRCLRLSSKEPPSSSWTAKSCDASSNQQPPTQKQRGNVCHHLISRASRLAASMHTTAPVAIQYNTRVLRRSSSAVADVQL